MAYERTTWQPGQAGGTLITATRLNNIEAGIVANDSAVTAVADIIDTGRLSETEISDTIVASVDQTRQNVVMAQITSTTQASPMADKGTSVFGAIDPAGAPLLTVSPSVARQQVTGVGAAVTDSSAYLLMVKLTKTQRTALLTDLFGPGGFQWIRVPLGGSDFNLVAERSIADTPAFLTSAAVSIGGTTLTSASSLAQFAVGDQIVVGKDAGYVDPATTVQEVVTVTAATTGTGPYVTAVTAFTKAHGTSTSCAKADPTLGTYNFAHEGSYLIPLILEILAINPGLKIFGSVWLTPLWTKNTLSSGSGFVRADQYSTIATMIVKMVQDYAAAGVTIGTVCPQNEPSSTAASLSYYAASDMATLVGLVRAGLDAAGFVETKILAGDDQWSHPEYPADVLGTSGAPANIDTVGFHAYSGSAASALPVSRAYGKPWMLTEIRTLLTDSWYSSSLVMAGDVIIGTFRNGAVASMVWNLALDEGGNPTQGSTGRRGVVTVPSDGSGSVTKFVDYYALKHFAKFVKPGAVRVDSTTFGTSGRLGTDLQSVAFRNTDGSVVLIAFNASSSTAKTVQIVDDRAQAAFTATVAAGEIVTYVWGITSDSELITPDIPTPPAPGPALAAPTLADTVVTAKTSGQTGSSLTFSYTVPSGSNRCTVVVVQGGDGPDGYTWERSVTLGGVPMKLAGYANGADGTGKVRHVAIYYLINAATGSKSVVATTTGREYINAVAFTLTGVDPFDPVGVGSESDGTSTGSVSVAGVGGTGTDYVLSALGARTTAALTPGSGLTVLGHSEVSNLWLSVARQSGAIAPVSAWTFTPQSSPDVYALAQVAFHGVSS